MGDTGKKNAVSLHATPQQTPEPADVNQVKKTFYESQKGSECSVRPELAKLAIQQESRRVTLQRPQPKAPLKRGSCMQVLCAAPKTCVTSAKKSVRLCAAPIKKC